MPLEDGNILSLQLIWNCSSDTVPLVDSLLQRCKQFLGDSGSSREMSARLLGRMLTRPDTESALQQLLKWLFSMLQLNDPKDVFTIPGKARPSHEIFPFTLIFTLKILQSISPLLPAVSEHLWLSILVSIWVLDLLHSCFFFFCKDRLYCSRKTGPKRLSILFYASGCEHCCQLNLVLQCADEAQDSQVLFWK